MASPRIGQATGLALLLLGLAASHEAWGAEHRRARAASAQTATLELVIQTGHGDFITDVAFSPDGALLASCDWSGGVKVWSVRDRALLADLQPGGTRRAYTVAFSPDGATLAVAQEDPKRNAGEVVLWDLRSMKPKLRLVDRERWGLQQIKSAEYSPDGRTLAVGGSRMVHLWDARTGAVLREFDASGTVDRLAYSRDGRTLACACVGWGIRTWDVRTGKEGRVLTGPSGLVNSVAYSPDGRYLAAGWGANQGTSDESVVIVWRRGTGQVVQTIRPGTNSVAAVAFVPDGSALAVACHDQTVSFWATDSWKRVSVIEGLRAPIAFSRSSKLLATATHGGIGGGTLSVRDLASGETVIRAEGRLDGYRQSAIGVAWSPDQRTIVSAGAGGIAVWDARRGSLLRAIAVGGQFVNALAFSPDGAWLTVGLMDPYAQSGAAQPWNARSWEPGGALEGPGEARTGIAASSDGRYVVGATRRLTDAGAQHSYFMVWDAATGAKRASEMVDSTQFGRVALSADSSLAAVAAATVETYNPDPLKQRGSRAQVLLWDMRSQAKTAVIESPDDHVGICDLAFSPDGSVLAAGQCRYDGFPDAAPGYLWHRPFNQPPLMLAGGGRGLYCIAFAPDGRSLLGGTVDGQLRAWDSATRQVLWSVNDAAGGVLGLSFSPDGKRMATGGADGSVTIRDARTGRALAAVRRIGASGWVATTPDGYYACSPGSERHFRWRRGGNLVAATSDARARNRPEVVRNALAEAH